jgi:anti-anti-sigma regulatory factor
MLRTFDVEHVLDAPRPGQRAALLTAVVDLDLATVDTARAELAEAVYGPADAVLLDVSGVFIGAVLVRCLVDTTERAARAKKPLVVVGAPHWLITLTTRLDMPPLPAFAALDEAVAALRAVAAAQPTAPERRAPAEVAAG